jgi:hypothetical protein
MNLSGSRGLKLDQNSENKVTIVKMEMRLRVL